MTLRIEQKHAATVACDAFDLVHRADDPAWMASGDLLEAAGGTVLVLESMQHDVELEQSDSADDRSRAQRVRSRRVEHLRCALFGELAESGVELLSLERVRGDDAREVLRREAWNAGELELVPFGERVADAEGAAVHHADHVARPRFLDGRAFTCEELLRGGELHRLPSPHVRHL